MQSLINFYIPSANQAEVKVVAVDKTKSRVYKAIGFFGKRFPIKGKHCRDYLLLIAM